MALTKEKRENKTVLFPVRLDKAILDSPLGKCPTKRDDSLSQRK
jgi:hypothetical protein